MGKIRVLEKNVSDKIAAGEVVERPASVIKELLENAVDAAANTVCVEIKGGGITYMRVTDNGIGMTEEDVSLSVVRHATSKIATEEDLTKISTLGFRGEALSSIAAVSRLEFYTKTKQSEVGIHMVAHNGEILELSEAGCPDGTTVVVRELFSTVPARMKFLKKDFTEAGYIEDIVSRLALSHPEISVKFINNGKELIFTPGDNLLSSAIYAVYGKDMKNAMVDAHFEERGVCVSGMCGKAVAARNNRGTENFFVNGRYIKSMLLSGATEEAYKNELMTGKFPACVLNIQLPPEEVDINIHPTKLEAKFSDEKHVYHCVYWAVKNALYRSEFVPKVQEHPNIKPKFVKTPPPNEESKLPSNNETRFQTKQHAQQRSERAFASPQTAIFRETDDDFSKPETKFSPPLFTYPAFEGKLSKETVQSKPAQTEAEHQLKTTNRAESTRMQTTTESVSARTDVDAAEQASVPQQDSMPAYRICGRVFATYIIVEKDGKMLMVDQHAAHERLRYEKLLAQYRAREITSQLLLCPEVLTLTATEFSTFMENQDAIRDLGFLAEEFGEKQIIVRGTPAEAGECDVKNAVLEVIEMLSGNRKNLGDDLAAKMLYSIACRGAVKANSILKHEEMKKLLDDVFRLTGINTCPHGRPITVEFTKEFIEKQFKRIV